jgi:hypothetical protein
MGFGGVPERSNGAVLKTAGGRKVARGFKSHPRRLQSQNTIAGVEGGVGYFVGHNTAVVLRVLKSGHGNFTAMRFVPTRASV